MGGSTPASTIGPWLPEGRAGRVARPTGLVRVESALTTAVGSEHPFVARGGRPPDGGRRQAVPADAGAAGRPAGRPAAPGGDAAAVVCELTHLATLYHDDVMDEAAVRRGAPSANSRWTNSIAILTGDLLFARASDLLADLGPEAVRIQAQTFERLVTGQIRETVGAAAGRGPDRALPRACWPTRPARWSPPPPGSAPSFAGVDARWSTALTAFGEEVGVAFQISDDLLDIVSQGGASGKPPGTDLREGIATLPALFALAGDDPAEARLRELVAAPDHRRRRPRRGARRCCARRRRSPGPTRCSREYADRARARLGGGAGR